jgi:histidyl-tRNA synthetase
MNQTKIKPQTLKGFRDFLPSQMAVRNYVRDLLISVFETYGFEPLETPTLEYTSTLLGKSGNEADKLAYSFQDQGNRQIGLRYDLTVPTAKVLAIYNQLLPLPFKRYQIQPIWRAEKPQKGRYREVLQCDIDTFGSNSPLADAEIITIIYTILQKLNFNKYSIRINSRKVLADLIGATSITEDTNSILQSLDKYSKINQEGVTKELISKGIPQAQIDSLFDYIKKAQPDENLKQVFAAIKNFGVPEPCFIFDPTMVRGLDYYTGTIFETYVEEPKIGSITGGGRYDNLVESLGGPNIPAVGTTIGLDRIVDCITELNLLPNLPKTKTKVLVANFGPETIKESLKLVSSFRNASIPSSIYPDTEKLSKQFKYADSLGIPFVAVIGPDEAAKNLVTLKNMTTGNQKTIPTDEIANNLI